MESGGDLLLEGLLEEGGPLIRVTDSGKGIPAEELSRVTEAFYMVDKSRSRAQGGAGLGLALCRRIVDLHGGTLELESRSGEGTRATVRLRGAVP
jgi:signal transduction histidine kinase